MDHILELDIFEECTNVVTVVRIGEVFVASVDTGNGELCVGVVKMRLIFIDCMSEKVSGHEFKV